MAQKILKYIDGIPLYMDVEEDEKLFKHFNTKGFEETKILIPNTKGFNYESPLGDKSVFVDDGWDEEDENRLETLLKEWNAEFKEDEIEHDYFPAGENKAGNPEKNGYAHGDIEKAALADLKYEEQEIREVYYGNWLRDFSQFLVGITVRPDDKTIEEIYRSYNINSYQRQCLTHFFNVFTHDNWIKLIEIIATKEFVWNEYDKKYNGVMPYSDGYKYIEDFKNKFPPLTKDTLGIYRPEEHIDNPKGQKDESKLSYIKFNYEYEKNKPTKIYKLYSGESQESLFINAGNNKLSPSYTNKEGDYIHHPEGLKYFIFKDIGADRPSSITYFLQQLRLYVAHGKNKVGHMHLGAALHVLEDYFSHTNFVEVCLIKLVDDKVYPWVNYVEETDTKVDEIKDEKFWSDKKKWVIRNPDSSVKHDRANCIPIVTGVFLPDDTIASAAPKMAESLFSLDFKPHENRKVGQKTLGDIAIITTLEAYAKKQELEKNTKYIDAKFWLTIYNDYLLLLDRITRFKQKHPRLSKAVDLANKILAYLTYSLTFFPKLLFNLVFNNSDTIIKEIQTLNYGTNPTHTQIAKDSFEHPLNTLAGSLAIEAVKDVVTRASKNLGRKKLSKESESEIIKKYFIHPCKTTWMDKIVLKWAEIEKNKVKIKTLYEPTPFHDELKYLKNINTNEYLKEFSKLKTWIQKFFFSFFFLFIAIQIVKAQDKKNDSIKFYETYTSYKNNSVFWFPRNWNIEKLRSKTSFDKILYKSFVDNENNIFNAVLYFGKTAFDSVEAYENYNDIKFNKNFLFKDSFKLHLDLIGQNKYGILYHFLIASGKIDSAIIHVYYTTFISQKDDKTYHIEMQHNHKNHLKLKLLNDFIINNFKFLEKPKKKIKKNKKT